MIKSIFGLWYFGIGISLIFLVYFLITKKLKKELEQNES